MKRPADVLASFETWNKLKVRNGDMVVVQTRTLDDEKRNYLCRAKSSPLDQYVFDFDPLVEFFPHASTAQDVPQTPVSSPPPVAQNTPPFSFKDFKVALRTEDTPTRSFDTPKSTTSHSSYASHASNQLSELALPPESAQLLGSDKGSKFRLLSPQQPVPIASSLSISLPEGLTCSQNTMKRIQASMVGMYVAQGCRMSKIGGSRLIGTVRRVVPENARFACITVDTRIVFEQDDEKKPAPDLTGTWLLSHFQFILTRFERPGLYEKFPQLGFPRGVLLHGPPGCGKTHIVKLLIERLRQLEVPLHYSAPHVASISSRALHDLFTVAEEFCVKSENGLAIIFLDSIEAVTRKRSGLYEDSRAEDTSVLMYTLLTRLDGISKVQSNRLIVIGATSDADSLDMAFRRPGRFDKEIMLTLPDAQARMKIASEYLESARHVDAQENQALLTFVRDNCVGYSPADLLALLKRSNGSTEQLKHEYLMQPPPTSLRSHSQATHESEHRVSQVGGQAQAQQVLDMALRWPLFRKQKLRQFGLDTVFRGILLYGPPGCAKSTLVRLLAEKYKGAVAFYSLSGADVYQSGFGDAEAAIRRVFASARMTSPSLLFFDEIDALVGSRSESCFQSDSVQSRVLSTFLNEMDGVDTMLSDSVTIIGATNRPESIDEALMRPGRFDKHIYIGPPNPKDVLQIEFERMGLDFDDIQLESLAALCEGMSGADISGACKAAGMHSFRESRSKPDPSILEDSLRRANRSCQPQALERYEKFALARSPKGFGKS